MTVSLVLACVWALIATLIAMGPRRFHWPGAWGLIAVGVPLVGWVTYQNGPIMGLLVLAGGMSVLRWPVIFLVRALRGARDPAE
ncbi:MULTISPECIES: DUF2484 family protein [unclassified Thioclava]|jgi:hypothetical protein|uniref:DUF2484 family protein n=1 Tax=unclassified Thioclava TaxID=2621713 RepID=UPI0009960229|nr:MULTISPECIES: DUF2484 family protein [unclassified Thioclava]MPQ94848.1 DUF2484 family protein [Thioclava sp. JE_KL1]OOY03290.1 hypothetical protein BMI87_18495 [Thioclava sp. F28-4]OOY07763.1 hypothetical protein BMI89_15165 [Thioclava sp. F36-7]OOY31075.1 hypothetical protein BMI88_07975 [Thioclava sp. F36-6]